MAHWKAGLHGIPWSRGTVWCPFPPITDMDALGGAGSCRWYFPECCWFPHHPVYQYLAALEAEVVPWCCKLAKVAVVTWYFAIASAIFAIAFRVPWIAAFLLCFLKFSLPPPQCSSELVATKYMVPSAMCKILSLLILINCHSYTELLSLSVLCLIRLSG